MLIDTTLKLEAATGAMGLRRWFWGEGVCAQALVRSASARNTVSQLARDYLDLNVAVEPTIEHVNNMIPAAAAALLYEQDGKAGYKALADKAAAWYLGSTVTRGPRGILEHWPGDVWADTAFMAGSFLLQYGRVFDRAEFIDEAVTQWLLHADTLTIEGSALFIHGTHAGVAIPSFWGRANAWLAMSGVDILRFAPDHPGTDAIALRLEAQLLALAHAQPPYGVWDVLVDGNPETRGILETSAAAGIGAAMLRFDGLYPNPTIARAGDLAVRASLAYVDDGVLTRTSAGTVLQLIPFGYSVIRDDRIQPWGQALALEAATAALERQTMRSAPSTTDQAVSSATVEGEPCSVHRY
ncbi:MAG: glycoside hydrolase family 88 protein [Microbacteriaceae bacterium]